VAPPATPASAAAAPAAAKLASAAKAASAASAAALAPAIAKPPLLPPGIKAYYLPASGAGQGLEYFPAMAGWMDVHYASAKYKVSASQKVAMTAMLEDGPVVLDWDQAQDIAVSPDGLQTEPLSADRFADLPDAAKKAKSHTQWNKDFNRWIRQNRPLTILRSARFKLSSDPQETRGDFVARLAQAAREKRDLEVAKLRRKYSSKFNTLNNRLMRAEQAVMREKEQSQSSKIQSAISFGTAILGAFMGRKAVSATSARRFGTAVRSASRIRKESRDVDHARERLEATRLELEELDARLQEDIENIEASFDPENEDIQEVQIKPKSTDMTQEFFGLVWMPYRRDARGQLSPDWQ
jgi:hypothetical protein